ncbi:MAG: NAD+ synthase [Gammaproteobacteria bacterium]
MRVALAQLNLTVGDVAGNAERAADAARRARDELGADLVVFPELTLTGYPPEDLLLYAGLRAQVEDALATLVAAADGIGVLVGYPEWDGPALYNAAALVANGRVLARYRKQLLPNYAVFDEKRYFTAAHDTCVVEFAGARIGITICEDLWHPEVARDTAAAGAEVLLNLSASPFQVGRQEVRGTQVFADRANETGLPVLVVNLVGGQDELMFDGGSLVVTADGTVAARLDAFADALVAVDFDRIEGRLVPRPGAVHTEQGVEESVWNALVLGTRDYARKNGFTDVAIGLSGGIDSALATAIAVDALGAAQVHTVMMPSRHTSDMSVEDAAELAGRAGTDHRVISIEPAYEALLASLSDSFGDAPHGLAEQNLQARCRGTLLMALSNRFGWLVLAAGNKSELAVGYATLYGDMAGGFAPLKDLTKSLVYRLVAWRNTRDPLIPARIIERPPSAELAPGQVDSDSLPAYEALDAIIVDYIEQDRSFDELLASGQHDPETLRRVVALIRANEYKRRQAPPGVRVTGRAFGRDRRYPITSGYRD